ncbi:MAG: MGMT family protein [Deltaproteobacteria bacterium]|nr:MGMT family protein [Deltaproteobacteria bacterium]
MKNDKKIYCWRFRIEDLEIYTASSNQGAIEAALSLEPGVEPLSYFQNRLPYDHLIEDIEKNESLVKAIESRLMNAPINITPSFDIQCTPFQMNVWKAVEQIPFGRTRTYGEVADFIGKKGGARAVGQAMNKNPLPIIFP